MKFAVKRAVSVFIVVLMVISMMITSACAADTSSTDAAASASEVAPVLMSFESADALGRNAALRVFTGENEGLGGKQEFVTLEDGTQCIQIFSHTYTGKHSAGSSDYRMMPHFKAKNTISENHKYVRITYMTTNKEANSITLTNNASGKKIVLAADTSVSNGKFVTSAPVEISEGGFTARFMQGNHCSLEYINKSSKPVIYIKEIIFFGTKEQAEAYDPSKGFDLSTEYKPEGTGSPSTATPTEPVTDNNVTNFSYITVEEPKAEEGTSTAEPVIMDFSTVKNLRRNASLRIFSGDIEGLEGRQEFVTLDDGTQCMQLISYPYTGAQNNGYSDYRMMPFFYESGTVTAEHKYVRVTFMTPDIIPGSITMKNNASGAKTVIVSSSVYSDGEFVRSNAVNISAAGLTDRFAAGNHCSFEFVTTNTDAKIYIKEIAFFTSEKQAYDYYGDTPNSTQISYTALNFGTAGDGIANRSNELWGVSTDSEEALDIEYAASAEWANVHYAAYVKAKAKGTLDLTQRYIRVLYSADNPDDVKQASMFIQNNKTGRRVLVDGNVVDTDGEFVLSPAVYMEEETVQRFENVFNALFFNTKSAGGKYSIKAIYFFNTREDAEAFKVISGDTKLSINGNDISKYQIVYDADAPDNVITAAESVAWSIKRIAGVDIPVVTDEASVSDYEILIGSSNRPLSTEMLNELAESDERSYSIYVKGNTLVVTSHLGLTTVTAVEIANKSLFYNGILGVPQSLDITEDINSWATDNTYQKVGYWMDGEAVLDPTVVTVDFTTDEGCFTEDNGETNWKIENGAYKTNAAEFASSYLHTYEKNVIFKAKLTYTAENDGSMGIMARVNSEHAYVKAGYDFGAGEWYIESRDGRDNYLERVASKKASATAGTVYELTLVTDGEYASLSVNGETVIADAKVNHFSAGRLGIYAENASVSVDDLEITLVSGQGTVWQNVAHTKLPYDAYLEGGTVHTRDDGSLTYLHPYGVTYESRDDGYSWQETETWSDNHAYSYSNMIRLNDGSFLRISQETVNGESYKVAKISTDDGITWGEAYPICDTKYKKTTTAHGSNMNDKLTQCPEDSKYPNRIFYCQTYEVNSAWSTVKEVEGRIVSCQFFYSDDNGKTWTKSETDSWEIEGIEDEKYISECKILICEDGTVRMYCSWNQLGYIVYSDSNDGGKTFGPIQYMYEFYCPASSMQFVRDPYADNDYTYYMVWPNADDVSTSWHQPRYRLSLAKTTNGKDWVYLGDVWRWESTYSVGSTLIHHIVDPFIYVTEDYIICGSGFSDSRKLDGEGGPTGHQGQRQHIYSIRKDTLPEGKKMNVFTDVEYGAPYYEAITFVSDEGLFRGTGDISFSPNTAMKREMFVTVLARLSNADVSAYTTPTFSDVAAGAWYTTYVEWAAANSIVSGIGNGMYGIGDDVTVQQACIILARYANYKTAANGTGKSIADFPDGADVADWAAKEVEWAIANGIYTGSAGKLNPTASASRALVATMFNNYVKAFGR